MEFQTTIGSSFTLSGPGLHTGKYINATVHPAEADNGIIFRRVDITPEVIIAAIADKVGDTNHGTTIISDGQSISTIEHLMSALHGMHVDNAIIDVDGPEVPILDGSARLWVNEIEKVGLTILNKERQYFRLNQTVVWSDEKAGIEMVAIPADDFQVVSTIDFKSDLIGTQTASFDDYTRYVPDFASCRTFVFLHEVEMLLAANLIKGGDLDNAIVFVDKPLGEDEKNRLAKLFNKDPETIKAHNGVLNNIEPYFSNEPARHKLLDFMGDIYLLGKPVKAHFFIKCPGHRANVALTQKLRTIMLEYSSENPALDINAIRAFMPHRYPMLLVDRILSVTDTKIIGIKNVTFNEPFFPGHFPDNPVMPGVLVIEAMAQVGGLFAMRKIENPENYSTVLARIQNVRFLAPVVPGDTLRFEITLEAPLRRGCLKTNGKAYVGDNLVASAFLTAVITKK